MGKSPCIIRRSLGVFRSCSLDVFRGRGRGVGGVGALSLNNDELKESHDDVCLQGLPGV